MKVKLGLAFLFLALLANAQHVVREKVVLNNKNVLLPGELSYPKTNQKLPLVIFVHGSGNVDRNGNQEPIIKASYIQQLADSLNHQKIAFYRYDKRTAVKENIAFLTTTVFEDYVSDVLLIINHFAKDERFSSIHLIGHSQGSLVAMLAANQKVKSVVSLAGAGESIDKTLLRQIGSQNEELAQQAQNHINELMATDTIIKVNPFLMQLFAPQNQKFLKSWLPYDPCQEIQKLQQPILLIQGNNDLQVTVEDAKKLMEAKTRNRQNQETTAELVVIETMNHILKTVTNIIENQSSYVDPNYPLSSEMIQALSNFIKRNG